MATHEMAPVATPRPQLVAVDGKTYPLESARVTSRAEAGIAVTRLLQCFSNPHDQALEVIYTLPLPADGAVLGYSIRMGERLIRGEVQRREKAEKAYRDALYDGRTAGLLEQDRADTFQQRLGNLPPRTRVEVEIEVLQPLRFLATVGGRSPEWEFRFPTVAGVRYEGATGRVPDSDRLDVDRAVAGDIPTRFELDVTIADNVGIWSPSHEISHNAEAQETRVRLARGERLDHDIVLRWNACAPGVGVHVVEGGGLEGDDGRYALITVVPPALPDTAFHRDLTVLIDASGSMHGPPLLLAKRVVADLVRSLEPGDRFELLAFANRVEKLTNGLLDSTPKSTQRALEALHRLQASGGTEMLHAMEQALEPLRDDAQRQIVLVTDGYIGFESEVIGRIARDLPAGVRVHAVGIGSAPNRTLLQGVAAAGRGMELSASSEVTASEAASRLCAGTVRPVLTNLAIRGTAVRAHAPERPRDVFAGQPVLLTLELDPNGGDLEICGRLAGASEAWMWRSVVPASGATGGRSPLPFGALHGREAISDLELRRAAEPSTRAAGIDQQIEARGMRHRIVSRRTSLVAIAEEPSVDPKAPRRRERLAVELPAGVSAEGAGLIGATGTPRPADVDLSVTLESVDMLAPVPDRAIRKSSVARLLFGARQGAKAKDGVPIGDVLLPASVIRLEHDLLIVEFETPFDGFELPRGRVEVRLEGLAVNSADVVAGESSPVGPHQKGLQVRLALRLEGGESWSRDADLELRWVGLAKSPAGTEPIARMRLRLRLPPGTLES